MQEGKDINAKLSFQKRLHHTNERLMVLPSNVHLTFSWLHTRELQ